MDSQIAELVPGVAAAEVVCDVGAFRSAQPFQHPVRQRVPGRPGVFSVQVVEKISKYIEIILERDIRRPGQFIHWIHGRLIERLYDHRHAARDFHRCFAFVMAHFHLICAGLHQLLAEAERLVGVSGLEQSIQPCADIGIVRRVTPAMPVILPVGLFTDIPDLQAQAHDHGSYVSRCDPPPFDQFPRRFRVFFRDFMDQLDELGLCPVLDQLVNFDSVILGQEGVIIVIVRFIVQVFTIQVFGFKKFQPFVVLFRFGNAHFVFDPLHIFDHNGHSVLAVFFIRAGAYRFRKTALIHGDHGRVSIRTVHPGDQAAVIRYCQA